MMNYTLALLIASTQAISLKNTQYQAGKAQSAAEYVFRKLDAVEGVLDKYEAKEEISSRIEKYPETTELFTQLGEIFEPLVDEVTATVDIVDVIPAFNAIDAGEHSAPWETVTALGALADASSANAAAKGGIYQQFSAFMGAPAQAVHYVWDKLDAVDGELCTGAALLELSNWDSQDLAQSIGFNLKAALLKLNEETAADPPRECLQEEEAIMVVEALFGGSEPIPRAVMEVFNAVNALASQSLKNDGTKEGIVEYYNNAIAMLSEDGGPESMDGMIVPEHLYEKGTPGSMDGMGFIDEGEQTDEDLPMPPTPNAPFQTWEREYPEPSTPSMPSPPTGLEEVYVAAQLGSYQSYMNEYDVRGQDSDEDEDEGRVDEDEDDYDDEDDGDYDDEDDGDYDQVENDDDSMTLAEVARGFH